jgi:TRAP-type uncharacterized transport system substrate-binding protein
LQQPQPRSRTRRARLDIDAWSNAQLAWIASVAAFVLAGGLWFFLGWFAPPPKHTLTIAAGSRTGAYFHYATRYRELLEAQGIRAEVIETAGTVDNLDRMRDGSAQCCADIAFAQAGPWRSGSRAVQSLASVDVEPLWIFVDPRRFAPKVLAELRGQHMAIGAKGSGTLPVAEAVLRLAGIEPSAAQAHYLAGPAALEALHAGDVAAAFVVASASAPIVEQAVGMGLLLLPLANALAFERRLPWSHAVTLPRGVLSVASDLPAADLQMLAVNTNLVSRSDLHESTKFLLLDIATRVHAEAGPLQSAQRYPSQDGLIFPQGEASKDFFATGRPWIYKVLPFWSAYQINRLLLSLLPVLVILVSLMRSVIGFSERRNRASIMRLLSRAKELEVLVADDSGAFDTGHQKALRLLERQLQGFKPLTIHLADYFRIHESLQSVRSAQRQLQMEQEPEGSTSQEPAVVATGPVLVASPSRLCIVASPARPGPGAAV